MPAGDALSRAQRAELSRAVARADQATGLSFLIVLGPLEDGRASARTRLTACGEAAARTVLIAVDPPAHRLEIVTGAAAASQVEDRTCGLAALAMTSSFSAGDLVGGLRNGLQVLADHGRRPAAIDLDHG